MKIAIIGSKGLPATYGGVEKVVERLSSEYVKMGHGVTVYSRFYYSQYKLNKFVYNGVNVINVKGIRTKRLDVLTHSFIASILASFSDCDVICYHSTVPGFFSFIPKLFGKKVFIHNHGLEILGHKWNRFDKFVIKILIRLTSKWVNGITTVSASQIDLCQKFYNRTPKLIPNGVDLVETNLIPQKQNYILFVGRIVPDKGLEYLIEAFITINQICPNYKLYIAGNSSYSDDYYNKITSLASVSNNIIFLGGVYGESLHKLYQDALFVVIPSLIESYSHVLMESLWLNGALICSDIPQFKLFANDYVIFFESKNTKSLEEKILQLLENKEAISDLYAKSKNFPFKNYSWKIIANKYNELFSSA